MRLSRLFVSHYRSIKEETINLIDVNVFIGANAAGKSTILDVLRFLHEGTRERDFRGPAAARGGIVHIPWKGEEARSVEIKAWIQDGDREFEWRVTLMREGYEFTVDEDVSECPPKSPPHQLLESRKGIGWWWSGGEGKRVPLEQHHTACALSAAAADASFPARDVAGFVSRWGFFDPNPFLLRRDWSGQDSTRFDAYGRNLAERLYALKKAAPDEFEQIVSATRAVLGLPLAIDPRESEDRFYFVQSEPGLKYQVAQTGASSGTLRMLALMTALFGEAGSTLIGLEEPENHIHPTALTAFVEYLRKVRGRVQLLVTTHSPLLLNLLDDPEAVYVVRHSAAEGTKVMHEGNPGAVRRALDESGFGLGDFYETKGFGAAA